LFNLSKKPRQEPWPFTQGVEVVTFATPELSRGGFAECVDCSSCMQRSDCARTQSAEKAEQWLTSAQMRLEMQSGMLICKNANAARVRRRSVNETTLLHFHIA
jgi:hypothetical protein